MGTPETGDTGGGGRTCRALWRKGTRDLQMNLLKLPSLWCQNVIVSINGEAGLSRLLYLILYFLGEFEMLLV